MRFVARNTLAAFWGKHPDTQSSLQRWAQVFRAADWSTMTDVQSAVPKAKVLNGERVRFEVSGGNYRMILALDFERQAAFVKFIGTHADYDRVDALTVSSF